MKTDDIEDLGTLLHIKLPDVKTKKSRSFTVIGENFLNIYRKYALLRPEGTNERRFFMKFQDGKCHRSVMGIHKIGAAAKEAAMYLNLERPEEYTGHCLRRTSATLLADSGADITTLKRHGGWKSSNVAEGYIEDSLQNKTDTALKIFPQSKANSTATVTAFNEKNDQNIEMDITSDMATENFIVSDNVKDDVEINEVRATLTDVNSILHSHGVNLHQPSNCTFVFNIGNK